MDVLVDKIADYLIRSENADNDIHDIYVYGIETALSYIISIVLVLLIGVTFKIPLELLAFFIAFSALRLSSGGYHARTFVGCTIASIAIILLVSVVIHISHENAQMPLTIGFAVIANILTFLFAPVENKNHPLDVVSISKFKTNSRFTVVCCTLICIGLTSLGIVEYAFYISLGVFTASASMLVALLQKKI